MERVSFLLEETGETVSCLLNPEQVVFSRRAGLRSRRSLTGALTGTGLRDDPLLYTGGGSTELQLQLLFDVSLLPEERGVDDVRELSRPLWELSENQEAEDGAARLRPVRFIWGKGWNLRGVVAAIAEKQDRFAPSGNPLRSWVSLRFVRVEDTEPSADAAGLANSRHLALDKLDRLEPSLESERFLEFIEVLADGGEVGEGGETGLPERPDTLAHRLGLNVADWRLPFIHSGIDDPYGMEMGCVLRFFRW